MLDDWFAAILRIKRVRTHGRLSRHPAIIKGDNLEVGEIAIMKLVVSSLRQVIFM